jgi:UDP-2,3-diacylglucosamine hydrolase
LGESRYLNLGEWVNYSTYAEFDGKELSLKEFKED